MSINAINRASGVVFGAIKGLFIGPVWELIDYYRRMNHHSYDAHGAVLILMLFITPFIMLYGLGRGLLLGAFAGFKGGIISSSEKKAAVHDLYQFFTLWRAAHLHVDDSSNSPLRPDHGSIKNYLARKYLGFSMTQDPNESVLLLKDLLEDPRYALNTRNLIRVGGEELTLTIKYGLYIEFITVCNTQLFSYLSHQTNPALRGFLPIIQELEKKQTNNAAMCALLAASLPGQIDECPAHETLLNPRFEKNHLAVIAGFLGHRVMPLSEEIKPIENPEDQFQLQIQP